MSMLDKFLSQVDFSSYEEFYEKFHIHVPENFSFAYDVVDAYAESEPDRVAIVWCDDHSGSKTITFGELKTESDRVAAYLHAIGVRKGDPVMLILKRRFEYWFCLIALHKMGAVAIPATHLLTSRDIEHRNNAAGIKMIISVDDERVLQHIDDAQPHSSTLQWKVSLHGQRAGWLSLADGMGRRAGALPASDRRPGVPKRRSQCCCISPPAPPACRRWWTTIMCIPSGTF